MILSNSKINHSLLRVTRFTISVCHDAHCLPCAPEFGMIEDRGCPVGHGAVIGREPSLQDGGRMVGLNQVGTP